jgi:peptidoglycan/LPS O-acetylase OafA/YrhL
MCNNKSRFSEGKILKVNKKIILLQKDSLASRLLDLFRGMAAILVLLNHFRSLFFENYQNQLNPSLLQKGFYLITTLGHESVIVFFVLSGLFISSSVINSLNYNKWDWSNYLINRLTRLYVVLIPALVLGVMWDQIGINILKVTNLYNGNLNEAILTFSAIDRSSIFTFLGNILFLQEIHTTPFGSNGALWSLSYEFWYYLIFPVLALAIFKKSWQYALISILLFAFVGKTVSLYFIVWVLGFIILLMPQLKIKSVILKLTLLITSTFAFIFSVLFSSLQLIPYPDIIIAICFATLVYFILSFLNHNSIKINTLYKLPKIFAEFSYSLYLVHTPFIVFIYALFLKFGFNKWDPSLINILIGSLIVVITIAYGWLVSRFTEVKTDKIKIFLKQKTKGKSESKKIA